MRQTKKKTTLQIFSLGDKRASDTARMLQWLVEFFMRERLLRLVNKETLIYHVASPLWCTLFCAQKLLLVQYTNSGYTSAC